MKRIPTVEARICERRSKTWKGFVEILTTATVSAGTGNVLLMEPVMLNSRDSHASVASIASPVFP
ncbi:defensin-like protein [Actinidia rufa]|uniref:Defensin-like protein n=1 Tax=Actinidia rufa TaxID=165716 RepID=A0A7J0GHR8_9ERIC|nr:defensin-like protein [Actinidia rufa]